VTVAVETPPTVVELPTVQTVVVSEEKVTDSPELAVAEISNVLLEGEDPTLDG
jgi:hypothetical protein